MRPFDEAEISLVRALVERPGRLLPRHEHVLRWALNLARLWILESPEGQVVVGPKLAAFRDRLRPLALRLAGPGTIDLARLGTEAGPVAREVASARARLLEELGDRVSSELLDREVSEKTLVLALGGGGGCGYVHLGAFALLEELGLRPGLIVGASMGAILGLFRARERSFREGMARAVTHQLSYKRMFRLLDAETRYAMPGALRLHLRSTLARFFVSERGETMRLDDLEVPFVSVVTGLEREAMRDVQRYERMFLSQLRKGTFARLLHVKDLVQNVAALLQDLYARSALTAVPLGHGPGTESFDVIDAVGFSAAVPAIIQYDITRDDPRMHELMRSTLDHYGVDVFADGGLVANVPARTAWEHVQLGRVGRRNAFILGLDCFAPQMGRNVLFLPLQRVAAQNVARNAPFAQLLFRYRRVLSATSLVPKPTAVDLAVRHGHDELAREADFLKKMMAPLPTSWRILGD
jgi:predicted acylesterase/phospholipase RssA